LGICEKGGKFGVKIAGRRIEMAKFAQKCGFGFLGGSKKGGILALKIIYIYANEWYF